MVAKSRKRPYGRTGNQVEDVWSSDRWASWLLLWQWQRCKEHEHPDTSMLAKKRNPVNYHIIRESAATGDFCAWRKSRLNVTMLMRSQRSCPCAKEMTSWTRSYIIRHNATSLMKSLPGSLSVNELSALANNSRGAFYIGRHVYLSQN